MGRRVRIPADSASVVGDRINQGIGYRSHTVIEVEESPDLEGGPAAGQFHAMASHVNLGVRLWRDL